MRFACLVTNNKLVEQKIQSNPQDLRKQIIMQQAKLVLSNGQEFIGSSPRPWSGDGHGEVVFTTGMTGYEETLTDPSYTGQILVFTYPILGNYGVSSGSNWESEIIQVRGIICETVLDNTVHYTQVQNFLDWVEKNKIPLISGVDTRQLTKVIRTQGVLNGYITNDLTEKVTNFPSQTINWVANVSPKDVAEFGSGKHTVILVDCGAKENIMRCLMNYQNLKIKRVPYNYDYSQEEFSGVLLSNGPGDPSMCTETIAVLAKAMLRNKPIMGICLGSQLMALAVGAKTTKLKYGHRGHNQPCLNLHSKKAFLTAQNHGYVVEENTLPSDWEVTYRNLNDNTIAGVKHKIKPFSSVQFHPEAASGPQDTVHLFDDFIQQVTGSVWS